MGSNDLSQGGRESFASPIVSIQNAFNLVNRFLRSGSPRFSIASRRAFAYSPLGQGYLTGKYEGGALPEAHASCC